MLSLIVCFLVTLLFGLKSKILSDWMKWMAVLLIKGLSDTVDFSWQIEKLKLWHWGIVTDSQRVAWTAFAFLAMFFCQGSCIKRSLNAPRVLFWHLGAIYWAIIGSCRILLSRFHPLNLQFHQGKTSSKRVRNEVSVKLWIDKLRHPLIYSKSAYYHH